MVMNACEKACRHWIGGNYQNVHVDSGYQRMLRRSPILGHRDSKRVGELPDSNALLLFPSTELSDCETLTVTEVGKADFP